MIRKHLWDVALFSMVMVLACILTHANFVAPAQAQDTSPSLRWPPRRWPPPPPPWPRPLLGQDLQLVSQSAAVDIHGPLARTHLTQVFSNLTNRTIEGTYIFPLPEGAALSGFAMTVNGKRLEAEILESDKARDIYAGIVQKMRDPAILEFIGRGMVRAKIFPIAPRASQKVELEYAQTLKPTAGAFRYALPLRLPVGGTAQSATVDIRISSPDGIRAIYSPTHKVEIKRDGNSARVSGEFGSGEDVGVAPRDANTNSTAGVRGGTDDGNRGGVDRDFVLYYTTARARIGLNVISLKPVGEDGYFLLLAAPDPSLQQNEVARKDVVFVCDTSGSMGGAKIEQARNALGTLVGSLNAHDRFNIITFSSDTRTLSPALHEATKANLDAARSWISAIKAVGGTNIDDALALALAQLKEVRLATETGGAANRTQQIVFMTDGQPTVGETDIDNILKNVRRANSEADGDRAATAETKAPVRARLFVFGVGYDVNTRLLDSLADENGGSSDYVLPQEDIEARVGSLYGKIAYPVLTNVQLNWSGVDIYDVYPKHLPDLFRGGECVVFGRYSTAKQASRVAPSVRLTGLSEGRMQRIDGKIDLDGDPANNLIARLWAMRKVGYLLDDARRNGRVIDDEVKNEIVALSKQFGIVTPFTAGLITDDEQPQPLPQPWPGPMPMPIPRGYRNNGAGGPLPMPNSSREYDSAGLGGNFAAAPSSGKSAVLAARSTSELRASGQIGAADSAQVRTVGDKTFVLKEGVWTDTLFTDKSPVAVVIKFASPQYFELLKTEKIAHWLSLGDRVVFVLDNRTMRIEP